MPKFLFVYHGGGIPESQEEQERTMAAWGAWYEGMGAATVDPGAPVGQSHTVSSEGHEDHGGACVFGHCATACGVILPSFTAPVSFAFVKAGRETVEHILAGLVASSEPPPPQA